MNTHRERYAIEDAELWHGATWTPWAFRAAFNGAPERSRQMNLPDGRCFASETDNFVTGRRFCVHWPFCFGIVPRR